MAYHIEEINIVPLGLNRNVIDTKLADPTRKCTWLVMER